MLQPFKISTGLKDLIGQGLITDDFVAVFELVKNSCDAHAKSVQLRFREDKIIITDNGKGMSRDDILNKWLFVAYSAKRDGTEDDGHRGDTTGRSRIYAGAKGVGRFSCDRLGKRLLLSSRAGGQPVQILEVDWTYYEQDSKQEFGQVKIDITESGNFPDSVYQPDGGIGTVLEINGLRSEWERNKLLRLKRELAKLINPFSVESKSFEIEIIALDEQDGDQQEATRCAAQDKFVNGRVENPILDVIKQRTTSIRVSINAGRLIETSLEDRGELIYKIKESSPYEKLVGSNIGIEIFFLNRSAKAIFARRMGLASVQFGSIFLFRNGFRVFPIGDEHDDFFGIARRQQQGTRRFLGSRDLIGHVEIEGVEGFDETTSRDGLIRTPKVDQLKECVRDKCVRRLERYVVDITWKDKFDKDVEDTSRMMLDESSARITQLVSRLADTEGVELVEYNPNLVRIIDEKSEVFESSLKALGLLAERTGDEALLARVAQANARIKYLQETQAEAQEAERRAEARATMAEKAAATAQARYGQERERNRFLMAAASLDEDTILNLHHQILMHASDVHLGVRRMMGKLRKSVPVLKEEWIDFLERVSFRNSQILTASRFATKGGYKQQSTEDRTDLVVYIRDYLKTVSSLWAPRGISIAVFDNGKKLERAFRPIEIGIVIDNLVSNAAKARAKKVSFFLEVTKGSKPELLVKVADNGTGWTLPLESIERVFEKGVTTTDGSGLGLYHVKQVIEGLGGLVEAKNEPYNEKFVGAQLVLRIPS